MRLTLRSESPTPDLRLPSRVDTDGPTHGLRLFVGRPDVYRALTLAPVRVDVDDRTCSPDGVRAVGFDAAEALLPADPREPEAVRLLAEWAVCPEKYLFVDVAGPLPLTAGHTQVDLVLSSAAAAALAAGVPPLRLGCVPIVNRRVVDLPPIPLRPGTGSVQLDVDPLADHPPRVVAEVLSVRAARAGRVLSTYAERLAPLPPPLVTRRVGHWALERRGDAAWLSLSDRGPAAAGRTLLVTAITCRRALPDDGPVVLGGGAEWVAPVRPPRWPEPAAAVVATTPVAGVLDCVARAFGRPEVAGFVRRCDAAPATLGLAGGTVRGTDVRLTVDAGKLTPEAAYVLVQVLDRAVATAGPVDGFTRVRAVTAAGGIVAVCPPRSGKDAIVGEVVLGGRPPEPMAAGVAPFVAGPKRSDRQAATVARGFAAVTRPTSVTALAAVLRHLLELPVRVRPFEPARTVAGPGRQWRLGGHPGRVLGRHRPCWGVRVVIGPLDRRTFDRFGPGTRAARRVRLLIEAAVGPACPVVVEPVLRGDLARPWRLGEGRLGRSVRVAVH